MFRILLFTVVFVLTIFANENVIYNHKSVSDNDRYVVLNGKEFKIVVPPYYINRDGNIIQR